MSKIETYILNVSYLQDLKRGEFDGYYSKGHHDPVAFTDEALKKLGVIIDPADVEHKYIRWNAYGVYDDMVYGLYRLPGCGGFPITVAKKWSEQA